MNGEMVLGLHKFAFLPHKLRLTGNEERQESIGNKLDQGAS